MGVKLEKISRGFCYGFIILFTLFLFLIFVGLITFYYFFDHVVYKPDWPENSRVSIASPFRYNYTSYEHIVLNTSDSIKLHAYFLKQNDSIFNQTSTILCFHGNDGNIGHRLRSMKHMFDTCKCNLFLVDYRGYGMSDGSPNEQGLYTDADTAVDYLLTRNDIDTKKIIVYGESLGGAVAIHTTMMNDLKVAGLIIVNSFTSVAELVKSSAWYFSILPNEEFQSQFVSIKKIGQIETPSLFVISENDTVVPPFMMNELYDRYSGVFKRKILIKNGRHVKIWDHKDLAANICKFIDQVHQGVNTNLNEVWRID